MTGLNVIPQGSRRVLSKSHCILLKPGNILRKETFSYFSRAGDAGVMIKHLLKGSGEIGLISGIYNVIETQIVKHSIK